MKNLTLVLLSALSVYVSSVSGSGDKSTATIKFGSEFELPKRHYELDFIGNTKEGFVMLSHEHMKSLSLQRFDANLKLTSEKEIPLIDMPKAYMSETIWDMHGKNYWFYSTWSKADPTERLFAQELDLEKGDFKGAAKALGTASDKIAGNLALASSYRFNVADKWNFVRSADSSKLLVHYRLKPKVKNDAQSYAIIGLIVYDKDLNKIWSREVEMPYTEKMMQDEDYQVDRNGSAYVLGKIYEEGRKESKNDHPNYHYEVLKYNEAENKAGIASFSFQDKYVVDIMLSEDQLGRMICTGYYSKIRNSSSADGLFLMTFDEAMITKNVYKGFYEFPVEIIKEFESSRERKKIDNAKEKSNGNEVASLKLRNMRVSDDGSISIFGEQYYYVVTTYYDGKSTQTRTTYYYQDIYGVKIDKDGELKWMKKIPKDQHGTNSGMSLGYFLHSDGDDSYLFFVDNIKNLDIKPEQTPATHIAGAGGVLVCVKVASNGSITKNSLFDFKEQKMNVIVRNFTDVSTNEIIGRAAETISVFGMGMATRSGRPLLISLK